LIDNEQLTSLIVNESVHHGPSIHPLLHGLSACRCPMSPYFLTRWVSRLLGPALASWATARVGIHRLFPSPFPFAFHNLGVFQFTLQNFMSPELRIISDFLGE